MNKFFFSIISLFLFINVHATETSGNDLSYDSFINSDKRIKCLYGYAAEKTGDHESAIKIFEDCITRWNDVYSMIWLAQIYETGVAVKQDLEFATALMKRGANTNDEAGYSRLAKYHYGVALYEGIGIKKDKKQGINWLIKSANEGDVNAKEYLLKITSM